MMVKFSGTVIHGLKLGRKIGFRTANILLKKGILSEGTYKINGFWGKKIYPGVGTYLEKKGVFEAHFLDFNKNIYGKEIEIIVLEKIRDNQKFENIDQIKDQIKKDVKAAKRIKNNVLTFGTFDVVHKGHKFYLCEAKKYGDYLITIIARDSNVKKFKGSLPYFSEQKRKKLIENLKISDKVLLGDKTNPTKCLEKYSPSAICLGYDQKGFSDKLFEYINKHNMKTEVIKIASFHENIYKSTLIKKKKLAKIFI